MTTTLAAGVDVGRDHLDVAVAPSGMAFRVANRPEGISTLLTRLGRNGVRKVVLESIGSYGAHLVRSLADAGFETGIVDPRRIKALRLAEGRRAKTDRLDAALIARFALTMEHAARPVPSAQTFQIRAVSARRRQLVELAAIEKTRLRQVYDTDIAESCRRMIANLSEERLLVEQKLGALLAGQPDHQRRNALLRTIPGIGPAIAMTLLADLPELGTLDRRAVASLAGVAPHPNQSGNRNGKAHIQGGRPCVRVALYFAALSATRSDNGFRAEYLAMRENGKPAKIALIAIARKLIVAANGMLKENHPWQTKTP